MLNANPLPIKTTTVETITSNNSVSLSSQFGIGAIINNGNGASVHSLPRPPYGCGPGYCWNCGAASLDEK